MGRHSGTAREPKRSVSRSLRVASSSMATRVASVTLPAPRMPRLRISRARTLYGLAFVLTSAFLLVNVVDPYSGAVASPYYIPAPIVAQEGQDISLNGEYTNTAARDSVTVTSRVVAVKAAAATAPAAGTPDPDTAQAIGLQAVQARGWGMDQYDCLVALWNRESHWNVYAHNTSSGAYGIPQSLPGEKMASVADDWQTNPATQIEWGLRYVEGRYGSPCGAWAHSEAFNWY